MGAIVVMLVLVLALAALVMLYAAFPYRGADTPLIPRLGRALQRGMDSVPVLDPERRAAPASEEPVSIAPSAQADARR